MQEGRGVDTPAVAGAHERRKPGQTWRGKQEKLGGGEDEYQTEA
jgi:hypothetical protein